MKKSFLLLSSAIFVLAMSINLFAQSHEMYLEKPTSVTYINKIVMGDTLADGSRADLQRVYVLQRGGIWFFNDVIKNIDWDVRIKAEDADGPKPLIYGSVMDNSTDVPIDFIDAQGSVFLKNICVNGISDFDPDYTSWQHKAPRELVVWNVSGDYTLNVDGCILLHAYQADLRTFSGIRSIIVKNTIFANSGTGTLDNMGDGRAVDLRKTSCDSLVMINNTFVNGQDRCVRHISSTASLNYFHFEHNTVVNNGGRYGVMALGLLGENTKVEINNNLFLDPMVFGADTASQRQYDFLESKESYSAEITTKANQVMIYHQKDTSATSIDNTLQFDISNNYYAFTDDITSLWANLVTSVPNPTLHMPSPLSNFIQSKVSADAFTNVAPFSFSNVPNTMVGLVNWNLSPLPGGAGENSSGGENFVDMDRRLTTYYRDTLDCSYSTSLAAYTAGSDGFPLGDLNWFPDKKSEWITDVKNTEAVPVNFSLQQNYPNPFNPSTVINFSIPKASKVTLSVYNLLGQKVASLVNSNMNAGNHEVEFNAKDLSSGIYFYSLNAGNFQSTKKMILIK
jgi:hypothetical protein